MEKMTRRSRRELRRAARSGRTFGLNKARLVRWRIILAVVLAPALIALALGAGKFVSMPLLQAWTLAAYEDGDYAEARERAGLLTKANYFEPFLPHLTIGTTLLGEENYGAAATELEESLRLWEAGSDLNKPPHAECKIRNNLALAMAGEADAMDDAGERADHLYAAEEVLAPCLSGGSSEQNNEDSGSTGSNGDKIQEQREQADEEAGNEPRDSPGGEESSNGEDPDNDPQKTDPDGEGEDGSTPTPGSDEADREDELQQRNDDADSEDSSEDGDDSDGDPDREDTKPW